MTDRTTPRKRSRVGIAVALACAGCGAPPDPVTFNRQIAPIIFENCAVCHRPGESAPFSLLTYQDVSKRARQIAQVTGTRFMPPWLPEPGPRSFLGERRLSDEQIEMIRRWVDRGVVEGDARDLPARPTWTEGWKLGPPDLVLEMPEPYVLSAEGEDIFRSFAIPAAVTRSRYVDGVEFRPGNPRIVHHATMGIDRTPWSRFADAQDPEPGFGGMFGVGEVSSPDGMFLGWTPGKLPIRDHHGLAWRLDPETDLVLQLHLQTSGKPEPIQATVGLFFAERPPQRRAFMIRIGPLTLDIPAGENNYSVEDHYVLPVDVDVLGVYPHAHYLGKRLHGVATLPGASPEPLIRIEDWDFNWQDDYRYAEPLRLPRGTKLSMHYTFDNSSANVRNPHQPPRRVVYGQKSSDEMADLWIQVLPVDPAQLAALRTHFLAQELPKQVAGFEQAVRVRPDDAGLHNNLAGFYEFSGRTDEALRHYEQAVRLDPEHFIAQVNLAGLLGSLGRFDDAIGRYRVALGISSNDARVHNRLGVALALASTPRPSEAIAHFRRALDGLPSYGEAHRNLGQTLVKQGRVQEGIEHLREAVRIQPEDAEAYYFLGAALRGRGRPDAAVAELSRALVLRPDDTRVGYERALALAEAGRVDDAIARLRAMIRSHPSQAVLLGELARLLATHPNPDLRRPEEALRLARQAAELTAHRDPQVLRDLAAAYAAVDRFDEALGVAAQAATLAATAETGELARQLALAIERYRQGRP